MRTARVGDRVQVHYVIRARDGSAASSRGRPPLELIVGARHPRLPGLGPELVGLSPGEATTVLVPPERGHGLHDPSRVRRCSRRRFAARAALRPGDWVRLTDGRGRRRRVRVLEVGEETILIDSNRRWAGQTLELEVTLVGIRTSAEEADGCLFLPVTPAGGARAAAGALPGGRTCQPPASPPRGAGEDPWRDEGGEG